MTVNPYEPPEQNLWDAGVLRGHYTPFVSLSLLAYFVSFCMPVFDAGTPQVMYGYQAFAFAIVSQYLPCWLANPMYWSACFQALTGNIKRARTYATTAFVLSVSQTWMLDDAPEAGFYLWSASMAFLAVSLIITAYAQNRAKP